MNRESIANIISMIDHTLLNPSASEQDIYSFYQSISGSKIASICIAPRWVKFINEINELNIPICTVIGFPNGYSTIEAKCYEAEDSMKNGAKEIDVVISIGDIINRNEKYIRQELYDLRTVVEKNRILKVIVESGALNSADLRFITEIVSESNADFIKTSTGFNFTGATIDAVKIIKKYSYNNLKIKASGGIKDVETAIQYLNLGVQRLGSSKLLAQCQLLLLK